MKDKLQDLKVEIFEKYPDWSNQLKFKDYLSGAAYGKGSPYADVETPFGVHRVSAGNLRKGNYPTIKTAIDQHEYEKNYNAYMIKKLGEEIFLLKPKWKNRLELMHYIPGKSCKLEENKVVEGGPFLRVRTVNGIHIVPVSRLRQGYFPSLNLAIELFDKEVKDINYTDAQLSKYYTVVKKFHKASEITEYVDISQTEEEKLELIKKTKTWFLVKDLRNDEYFYQRRVSINTNSKPSIKNAFNEISLLNKITPNDKRQFPIQVIRRLGKIGEEISYEIEWCGCLFEKEQSWITKESGREPRQLCGNVFGLVETANKVFQYRNPEMAKLFTIRRYIPNMKNARVKLSDQDGIEYDFRWSDILAGKTPEMRSATYMPDYIYREMKEKKSALFDKIEIHSFADTKEKSNANLIKIRYILYGTIHEVYKSVLISAEKLTLGSAVDPLGFIRKKIEFDHPKLFCKIEILQIRTILRITKRSKNEKETQVLIKVLENQKENWVPLTYLQNNHYLSSVLGELTQLPLLAIVKIDPSKMLNAYFIEITHPSGCRAFKIGCTSYKTPEQRVKTMGNGWVLHNCICFEQQTAIDIYEFERDYKMISTPEIPKEFRPNNGFTEFIWNVAIKEKWEMLSNAKMTFEKVKDFLKSLGR